MGVQATAALQTNVCDRTLAPMYITQQGRHQEEMVSFRGWSGSGALMVDSWLRSVVALVWAWCVLGLTPATLGAEGVVRIGQFLV